MQCKNTRSGAGILILKSLCRKFLRVLDGVCLFVCLLACLLAAKVLIVGCSLQHIRSQCCQAKTPDHRYVFTPWKRHMALHQSKRSVTLQGEKRRKTGWAATWKRRALASQSSNSNNSNPSRPIQSSSQSTARVRLCYCTFSQPHSKHLVQKQKNAEPKLFCWAKPTITFWLLLHPRLVVVQSSINSIIKFPWNAHFSMLQYLAPKVSVKIWSWHVENHDIYDRLINLQTLNPYHSRSWQNL